jgi:cytoskeletal protein RodZ
LIYGLGAKISAESCAIQFNQMNQTSTKAGFGEHLRREREMRGISLDEICSATRIGTRFLNALENEQWDQLPGGVFNRGFVRAVAHHLGLDEESLLAEYMLATGDRATASASVVRASAIPEPRGQWVAWVLALIVIGALAGGGIYGWRKYAAHKRAAHPAPPTTQEWHAIIRSTNTA